MSGEAACPVCGRSRWRLHLQMGTRRLERCAGCGLIVTAPPLTRADLAGLYEEGYYSETGAVRFRLGLAERAMRLFRRRRAAAIRRLLPGSSRVLDVGCGRGYMLRALQDWGHEVHGTQLSSAAVRFAREHLGLAHIFQGDLWDAAYPDGWFDFISLYHVFEHLPDPGEQLRELYRILKPEGLLYIEVPNSASLSARWLGPHWLAWDLPRHLCHYDPATLSEIGARFGFQPVRRSFLSLEYSPATLLFSLVSAVFRDENWLFRYLTGGLSATESPQAGRAGLGARLAVRMTVALILAAPAIAASLLLAACRRGDTIGIYFRRQPVRSGCAGLPRTAVLRREASPA
ncbi:MAG: class I SAM-dependent methyltransferase [Nitrospira sp.]|nr:class I SAM-dependent methyltransferase [Nitrospira sp.]